MVEKICPVGWMHCDIDHVLEPQIHHLLHHHGAHGARYANCVVFDSFYLWGVGCRQPWCIWKCGWACHIWCSCCGNSLNCSSTAQTIQQWGQSLSPTHWSGVPCELDCPRHARVAMLCHIGSVLAMQLLQIRAVVLDKLRCSHDTKSHAPATLGSFQLAQKIAWKDDIRTWLQKSRKKARFWQALREIATLLGFCDPRFPKDIPNIAI